MSEDSDDTIELAGLPDRVSHVERRRKRDAITAIARRAGRSARDAREHPVGRWLEARARDAAEFALRPESVESVQSALVFVANLGLDRTRSADPNADLFLDFLQWLETRHSRETVAKTFAHNTPVLKRPWMQLVQSVATPGGRDATAKNLVEVQKEGAILLGELAGLEHPSQPPRTPAGLVDYFDSEWIPRRFLPLAHALQGETTGQPTSRNDTTTSTLARFIPSLDDPVVRFLVSTLLAVSNAYMTRELLERLPEMVEMIRNET